MLLTDVIKLLGDPLAVASNEFDTLTVPAGFNTPL